MVFVAVAITFFVVSFIILGKLVVAKIPVPGLQAVFGAA
jgi:hypothetical protein